MQDPAWPGARRLASEIALTARPSNGEGMCYSSMWGAGRAKATVTGGMTGGGARNAKVPWNGSGHLDTL